MAQTQIQFQTITTGRGKATYTRTQWSNDAGATWHEPEDAPVEVARAWQAVQAHAAKRLPADPARAHAWQQIQAKRKAQRAGK